MKADPPISDELWQQIPKAAQAYPGLDSALQARQRIPPLLPESRTIAPEGGGLIQLFDKGLHAPASRSSERAGRMAFRSWHVTFNTVVANYGTIQAKTATANYADDQAPAQNSDISLAGKSGALDFRVGQGVVRATSKGTVLTL